MIHHRLTGEQSLTKHKLPASLFERQEGLLQREPLVSDQMLFSCPVAVNKQRTSSCAHRQLDVALGVSSQ